MLIRLSFIVIYIGFYPLTAKRIWFWVFRFKETAKGLLVIIPVAITSVIKEFVSWFVCLI